MGNSLITKKYILLFLIVAGGLATFVKHELNKTIIFYKEGIGVDSVVTSSINESKKYELFICEYQSIPNEIVFGDRCFRIKEAWLEKRSELAYEWIWFFYPRPVSGVRVMIIQDQLDEKSISFVCKFSKTDGSTFNSSGKAIWANFKSLENNSIEFELSDMEENQQRNIKLIPNQKNR
jgi:hypothetical protein